MMAAWKKLSAQFSGRTRREQIILALAIILGTAQLLDLLWLTPSFAEQGKQTRQLQVKRTELSQLTQQEEQLQAAARGADVANRAAMEAARRELETVSAQLAGLEKRLVPARMMPEFLHGLLPASGGLEVVSLKTLAPEPLVSRAADPAASANKSAAAAAGNPVANLYKHGVEIKVAGSYPALLAYLAALEQSPQKVLWGRLELRVVQHPLSEMTLTLYTLSLDPSWLIV